MKIKNVMLLLILCCFGCKDVRDDSVEKESSKSEKRMKFDKVKWNVKSGYTYPYRDKMLNELLATDTLKKLNKKEVISMLGKPTRIDNVYLFYTIAQERLGFFPLHTKTLVIKLTNEGKVKSVMIHK